MALGRTPFTDSGIQRRVISEMVSTIDWTSGPLPKRLGMNNETKWDFLNWKPGGGKKVEWLEDTLENTTDALDGAVNASQTTFVVDNGEYFHAGHVVEVESEYVIVQDRSGNTLTVERGQGGTTAATHANNTAIEIIGIAKKTGDNYTIGHTTTMDAPFNYMQVLEESIVVNGDQIDVADYGVPDAMAYHLSKVIGGGQTEGEKGRAGKLFLRLVDMAYKGKRQQPSGTVAGMAGGFKQYITTNLTGTTSTRLERDTIESQIDTIYTSGGMVDLIVCSPFAARKIASFYEGFITTDRSEERGGSKITTITTAVMDNVEILVDWKCPNTELYILDSEKVGWITADPFDVLDMSPSSKSPKQKIFTAYGEYSFVVCNETSHAIVTHSNSL